MEDKDLKNYEIAFLTRIEEDAKEIISALVRYQIKINADGKNVQRIRLAYPIKKENFAFFDYFFFSAPPQEMQKLREELKMNQRILRFIIIAQPLNKITPAPVLKPSRNVALKTAKLTELVQPPKRETPSILSNEALEKKLEEILNK